MPTIVAALVPLKPSSLIAASDSHPRNYGSVRRATLGEQWPACQTRSARSYARPASGFEVLRFDLVEEVAELVEQGLVLRLIVCQVIRSHETDLFEQCLLRIDGCAGATGHRNCVRGPAGQRGGGTTDAEVQLRIERVVTDL